MPRRRRARGAPCGAALVLALGLLAAGAPGGAPGRAAPGGPDRVTASDADRVPGVRHAHPAPGPARGPAPADGRPVRVTLNELTPLLPSADDTLTVRGDLTNTSGRRVAPGHLGPLVDGVPRAEGDALETDALEPGATRSFTLRVPAGDLDVPRPGVHSFGVGLTTGDGVLAGLGRVRLPWAPDGLDGDPLDVAALWPLTDVPHLEPVSIGWGDSAQPVFRDDALAGSFAPGGRLRRLVDAADGLPVTWTADPALLDEARAMAGGYRVAAVRDAGDPQRSRPGTGRAAAASWLGALRGAVRGQDLVALPYADPDVAALAHVLPARPASGGHRAAASGVPGARGGVKAAPVRSGAPAEGLPGMLRQSVGWGGAAASAALGVRARADIVWPYDGALDSGITGVAGAMGTSVFIASGRGLSTGSSLARVSLGGGASALVGAPAVTAALGAPATNAAEALSARQDLLAALLTARLAAGDGSGAAVGGTDGETGPGGTADGGPPDAAGPGQGGSGGGGTAGGLLVVPPRQMTGAMAGILAQALKGAHDAGWLRMVGLDDLGSGTSEDLAVAAVAAPPAGRGAVGRGAGGVTGAVGAQGKAARAARAARGRSAGAAGSTGQARAAWGRSAWSAGPAGSAGRATRAARARPSEPARPPAEPPVRAAVAGSAVAGSAGPAGASARGRPGRGSGPGGVFAARGNHAARHAGTGPGERTRALPQNRSDLRKQAPGGRLGESYPQGLRAGELTSDDVAAVAAIQPDLGTLSRVLSDPARTLDAVHRAMLRAVSTGWRVGAVSGDAADQKSYTGGVRAYVDNSIASVHLLPKRGTVTLAGDAASVPVTVSNGLQQSLAGLELRVVSSAPNRVTVERPATPVEAPPAANHTEQVRVRAHANGPVEITAQLYTTSNHRPWGRPITFRLKVSRLSPLVVGVIASGALLALLAGAFQTRRARRRAVAAASPVPPAATPGGPGNGTGGG